MMMMMTIKKKDLVFCLCFFFVIGVEPEPFQLGEHLVDASGDLRL